MKRFAIGTLAALVVVTASHARTPDTRPRPGDRPAANPHSTRSVVYGRNGMIATSQPLASAAGLEERQGGGEGLGAGGGPPGGAGRWRAGRGPGRGGAFSGA